MLLHLRAPPGQPKPNKQKKGSEKPKERSDLRNDFITGPHAEDGAGPPGTSPPSSFASRKEPGTSQTVRKGKKNLMVDKYFITET